MVLKILVRKRHLEKRKRDIGDRVDVVCPVVEFLKEDYCCGKFIVNVLITLKSISATCSSQERCSICIFLLSTFCLIDRFSASFVTCSVRFVRRCGVVSAMRLIVSPE